MSALPGWSRGNVIQSRIDFTQGGPVTTIYYRSSIDGMNYYAQCSKEVIVLLNDDIELFAPAGTVVRPLSRLPVFSIIRQYISETYGVDIDHPTETDILRFNAVAYFARASSQASVQPTKIINWTRMIIYDHL
jgi:hypothetical protein